jgi:GNAT superfamily N-acetyltransferase
LLFRHWNGDAFQAFTMQVTRTYLEMTSAAELMPAAVPTDHDVRVDKLSWCPASFYRYLYLQVGSAYHWLDRAEWSDARIDAHLARPEITMWLLTRGGAPAGYFELERHPADDSVEIAYFGLLPEAIGRRLGGHLLTEATRRAWAAGPRRVWLHTCTLDHPAALPNYLARGFRIVRTETYTVD